LATCSSSPAPTEPAQTRAVNAAPGFFVEAPSVLDGASQLLIDVFGWERGSHARMALYQPGLPGDAPLSAELVREIDG
jgi:hypothetical protein